MPCEDRVRARANRAGRGVTRETIVHMYTPTIELIRYQQRRTIIAVEIGVWKRKPKKNRPWDGVPRTYGSLARPTVRACVYHFRNDPIF